MLNKISNETGKQGARFINKRFWKIWNGQNPLLSTLASINFLMLMCLPFLKDSQRFFKLHIQTFAADWKRDNIF